MLCLTGCITQKGILNNNIYELVNEWEYGSYQKIFQYLGGQSGTEFVFTTHCILCDQDGMLRNILTVKITSLSKTGPIMNFIQSISFNLYVIRSLLMLV